MQSLLNKKVDDKFIVASVMHHGSDDWLNVIMPSEHFSHYWVLSDRATIQCRFSYICNRMDPMQKGQIISDARKVLNLMKLKINYEF